MKTLNLITLLLVIIGGLNWLCVGAFQFDMVAALFGGVTSAASRTVYVLVGLSAIYQLVVFFRALRGNEVAALHH